MATNKVISAAGDVLAVIEPPPGMVLLVSPDSDKNNHSADSVWKQWINNLANYVQNLSEVSGAFTAPHMTTAERDALIAVNGMIVYNTTTNVFNFYENGLWVTK